MAVLLSKLLKKYFCYGAVGRLFAHLDVICKHLEKNGPLRFGQIQDGLEMSPSVLSRSLTKLQDDGRVEWEYVHSGQSNSSRPYRRYVLSKSYHAARARDLIVESIAGTSPLKLRLTQAEESVLVFSSEDFSQHNDDIRRIEEHEYSRPSRIVEYAIHLRLANELRQGTHWAWDFAEYIAWQATNEKLAQTYANLAWLGYLSGKPPSQKTPTTESFYDKATEDYVPRDGEA